MITIESLIRTASGMASGVIAVAAAHDEEVLKAVCEAKRKNIANAILVGNVIRIKSILSELGEEDSRQTLHLLRQLLQASDRIRQKSR